MFELTRICGISLISGGALLIMINTFLTPLMPYDQSDAFVRSSTIYLIRMSVSGLDAMLLLLGTVGVYLGQQKVTKAFGMIAFLVAFTGTALLVAVEWSNVFVLRPLAQISPDALVPVGDSSLLLGGSISAVGLFALGWLLLAISVAHAGVLSRWNALMVITGLILTPALTFLGVWGAIVGSAVLGAGFIGLGMNVFRLKTEPIV